MPSAIGMISPHHKIMHSSVYSTCISSILSSIGFSQAGSAELSHCPVKVAVIGSGQSAAEVVIDLRAKLQDGLPLLPSGDRNLARHEIDLIISKGSLKPSDDSPFSNEIFDPTCAYVKFYPLNLWLSLFPATDMIFNLRSKAARDAVIREFKGTNYGVVNPRTIENVSGSCTLCLMISPSLGRSSMSYSTSNRSTIPSLNERRLVAMKRSMNKAHYRLVSPSEITPLSSL